MITLSVAMTTLSVAMTTLSALLLTTEAGATLGVRNCLLSRQQCADDPACRSILDTIPRVCGPETVACSTVTVNKCQAALRTLQGFPYFQPTCLCHEPHVDPECNTFHEFIFDHPCATVDTNTGPSRYTVHALPTCHYALKACHSLPDCIALYDTFQHACQVKHNTCVMTSGERCLNAWTKLKMSPMFGCICTNNIDQQQCRGIFDSVHQNPCVDSLPVSNSAHLGSVGGARGSWDMLTPPPPATLLPPGSPQLPLFRALPPHISVATNTAKKSRYNLPSQSRSSSSNLEYKQNYEYFPPVHATPAYPYVPPSQFGSQSTHQRTKLYQNNNPVMYASQTQNVFYVHLPTPQPNSVWPFTVNVIPRVNSSKNGNSGSTGGNYDLKHHQQMMNPLTASTRDNYARNSEPKSATGSSMSRAASILGNGGAGWYDTPGQVSASSSAGANTSGNLKKTQLGSRNEPLATLHKTCSTTLHGCLADRKCKRLLDSVLVVCHEDRCDHMLCKQNLQKFYTNADVKWAMDVAFCLCKRTHVTADSCLADQERLHPECARRPATAAAPLCHALAETCKRDAGCRHRLEYYEQACAVDSDTSRCAGSSAECRQAVTGILGTELRVMCSCAGLNTREAYFCMDWQRILWFNPCVVESQRDYHRNDMVVIPPEKLPTSPTLVSRRRGTTDVLTAPSHTTDWRPRQPATTHRPSHTTTTTRRPTTTRVPPNSCSHEGRDYIVEGEFKRYYKSGDQSASDLCQCVKAGHDLECKTISHASPKPCKIEKTNIIYQHSAPAFKAFQGDCICYSGSFICVRPANAGEVDEEDTAKYQTGEGVFLYIGFSPEDERILRNVTGRSVLDALPKLQILQESAAFHHNGSFCQLAVFEQLDKNLVIQVTLPELDDYRENLTAAMLHREKDQCASSVAELVSKINRKEASIRHDAVLSMLMLAEISENLPPAPAGTTALTGHQGWVAWSVLQALLLHLYFQQMVYVRFLSRGQHSSS